MATKLDGGGGGKALVAGPLKKILFLRLPLFDIIEDKPSHMYLYQLVALRACEEYNLTQL